jgi:hypothetical protein
VEALLLTLLSCTRRQRSVALLFEHHLKSVVLDDALSFSLPAQKLRDLATRPGCVRVGGGSGAWGFRALQTKALLVLRHGSLEGQEALAPSIHPRDGGIVIPLFSGKHLYDAPYVNVFVDDPPKAYRIVINNRKLNDEKGKALAKGKEMPGTSNTSKRWRHCHSVFRGEVCGRRRRR